MSPKQSFIHTNLDLKPNDQNALGANRPDSARLQQLERKSNRFFCCYYIHFKISRENLL